MTKSKYAATVEFQPIRFDSTCKPNREVRSIDRSCGGDVKTLYDNESLLRQGFENLKKLYGARGYINFTPVPIHDFDEQNKLVHLTINVDEDRQFFVGRIAFRGNTTTHDKVIRREIMVNEAQIFNSALWDMSLLRLNQLGYFEETSTFEVSTFVR